MYGKTQFSFSDDPKLLGRPENFKIHVREVYVSAGAGFVVVLTGSVMTLPDFLRNRQLMALMLTIMEL